jgi:hypothetical protein
MPQTFTDAAAKTSNLNLTQTALSDSASVVRYGSARLDVKRVRHFRPSAPLQKKKKKNLTVLSSAAM